MQSRSRAVVVIVEPDADNREMYSEYLRLQRLLPVPVSSARDALIAAPTADVLVTGTYLPGTIDGFELITRLRSAKATERIPIILLTAAGCHTERERAVAAQCDAFLLKPCVPDVLVSEIHRVVSEHRAPTELFVPADLGSRPRRGVR